MKYLFIFCISLLIVSCNEPTQKNSTKVFKSKIIQDSLDSYLEKYIYHDNTEGTIIGVYGTPPYDTVVIRMYTRPIAIHPTHNHITGMFYYENKKVGVDVSDHTLADSLIILENLFAADDYIIDYPYSDSVWDGPTKEKRYILRSDGTIELVRFNIDF